MVEPHRPGRGTASVGYGCATFIDLTLSTFSESFATDYSLSRVFIIFLIVLAIAAMLNIFSGHLMAVMNNISVWWHVLGAAFIIVILFVVPDNHQSFSYVFTERFNNSGYSDGSSSSAMYWFLVVPFGLLLTQYTITGFDASAHLSEETQEASDGAAKGIWRSIFYSAIGGWIILLAFLFAIPDDAAGNPDNAGVGSGGVAYIFTSALESDLAATILLVSAVGQFFCTTACLTSASRMTFAFSRDGAIPGSSYLAKGRRQQSAEERRPARGRGGGADHPAGAGRGQPRDRGGPVHRPDGVLRRCRWPSSARIWRS